jgi:hypothetical protein
LFLVEGGNSMLISIFMPIAFVVGLIYLSVKLWSKKRIGKALKTFLIIFTALMGLVLLLLLDILFGFLLGMNPHW